MAIMLKTPEQIEKIRESSRIVIGCHKAVEAAIRAGVTTQELDEIAGDYIKSQGAISSSKGYNGFPANVCISVNEEVIHGIPGLKKLRNGDIVSVDIVAYKNGFHGDAARTYGVGQISDDAKRLIEVTRQSFFEGIAFAKTGNHLHQISEAIQAYVEPLGFTVVREFCGHGIGKAMHEDPQIPNYKQKTRGPKLCPGMVLAIEPMINAGKKEIVILEDKWTVATVDRKYSAHYENTILITDGEPEILTL